MFLEKAHTLTFEEGFEVLNGMLVHLQTRVEGFPVESINELIGLINFVIIGSSLNLFAIF